MAIFRYCPLCGGIGRKPPIGPNGALEEEIYIRANLGVKMPIASPEIYSQMLDRAKSGAFAYPAINVSSSSTVIAALRGFAEANSDGIIQFSWGGAEFASGSTVKKMVDGAVALAEFAHVVAKNYNVQIGLHTDHCPAEKLDGFMRPLLDFGAQVLDRMEADPPFGHSGNGGPVAPSWIPLVLEPDFESSKSRG